MDILRDSAAAVVEDLGGSGVGLRVELQDMGKWRIFLLVTAFLFTAVV